MPISWMEYLDLIERQQDDAESNLAEAEKIVKECKAKVEAIKLQKKSFLDALDDLGGIRGGQHVIDTK